MDNTLHRRPPHPWLLLGGALLCNAAAQQLFAAALREGCTPAFAAWLNSAVAALAIFAWLRFRGARRNATPAAGLRVVLARHRGLLTLAALAGATADVLILTAVHRVGPELTAFLANATPAILVLAGLFAGEAISPGRLGLAVVAIGGAFIFAAGSNAPSWDAIVIIGAASLLTATKQFSLQHAAKNFPVLAVLGVFYLALLVPGTALLAAQGTGPVSLPGLLLVVAAGLTGNVLGLGLLFRAFASIGVGRAAPADSLRPVMVALLGTALGTARIEAAQWWGAACVAGGVAGAFWLDRRRWSKISTHLSVTESTAQPTGTSLVTRPCLIHSTTRISPSAPQAA